MKHVSTLAVGALPFYRELNTLPRQSLKSKGIIKMSKTCEMHIDGRSIYIYVNRTNVYLSNQTFLKKFGRP